MVRIWSLSSSGPGCYMQLEPPSTYYCSRRLKPHIAPWTRASTAHITSIHATSFPRSSHHLPINHHSSPASPPVWSDQIWPVGMAMMEEGARSCLLQSRSSLEQDIRASYLMDHMISDGVLTGDEEDRIRSKVG